MKKTLIVCSVLLFFAVTSSAQTPTYKELSATAYNLLKGQDYIGAHKAFHTMDSLYGISDFEALYYYYSLSHDFVHDSEAEKALTRSITGTTLWPSLRPVAIRTPSIRIACWR